MTIFDQFDRPASAAGRAAADLREQIVVGTIQPGERLSEERVRDDLGIARSTLREAFQLLIHDRLLVHRLNRGVFVRELTLQDIGDIFEVRRVVGCGALLQVRSITTKGLRLLSNALDVSRRAADQGDWQLVAAENIRYHQALCDLAGSERLSRIMWLVLGEFRLAPVRIDHPPNYADPFLIRNEELAALVLAGNVVEASKYLASYLDDAEAYFLQFFDVPADTGVKRQTRQRNVNGSDAAYA